MNEKQAFDFWYAVNNTDIVVMPRQNLETFGSTILTYHLVTETMDDVTQVRVREGRILAAKPQIITPTAYSETILEGFGQEAQSYVEWLKEHERDIRILQYGYSLRKESFSEHTVTDNRENVVERVKRKVEDSQDPLSAVVVGVEEPWDVCLVKLFWEVIKSSSVSNVKDMEKQHLFDVNSGVARWVRDEIEKAFTAANHNPALIDKLAAVLKRHHLFEEYEDRFFSLVKSKKR